MQVTHQHRLWVGPLLPSGLGLVWTLILRGLDSGPCGGTEAHSFVSGQQQGTQDSGQDGHHSHEHCFVFFFFLILYDFNSGGAEAFFPTWHCCCRGWRRSCSSELLRSAGWGSWQPRVFLAFWCCGWLRIRLPFLLSHIHPWVSSEASWVFGSRALLFSSGLGRRLLAGTEDSIGSPEVCLAAMKSLGVFVFIFFLSYGRLYRLIIYIILLRD